MSKLAKDNLLLIWVKEPGKNAKTELIENTLEAFQERVNGYIEAYVVGTDGVIICNENGRLLGLDYNCEVLGEAFVGTILFVGVDEDDPSEFADFPIKSEKSMRKMFPQLWEES